MSEEKVITNINETPDSGAAGAEENVLEVKDLHTSFFTDSGEVQAVNGVSFNLGRGKILGVVGESGSGKSVTAYSIMQILASTGKVVKGEILFNGENILNYNKKQMDEFRGEKCSIIFQDPMTSLNPTFTVGWQLREALRLHTQYKTRSAANRRAVELLEMVGVNEPESRIRQYPLVTHDLGVIASMCDEIIVMYGGRVCERGTADDIFYHPCHEYTKGLLRSIPNVDNMKEKLVPIGGSPINMLAMPKGCAFCPRCENALKVCLDQEPEELQMPDGHYAACWLNVKKAYEEEKTAGKGEA